MKILPTRSEISELNTQLFPTHHINRISHATFFDTLHRKIIRHMNSVDSINNVRSRQETFIHDL